MYIDEIEFCVGKAEIYYGYKYCQINTKSIVFLFSWSVFFSLLMNNFNFLLFFLNFKENIFRFTF